MNFRNEKAHESVENVNNILEKFNELTDFFSKLPGRKTRFDPNSIKFDAIREISKLVNKLNRKGD